MEEWRQINEYPAYEVSDWGRVRHGDRILKQRVGTTRYYIIELGRSKTFKVHRLVALTFLPNPDNKSQVDHINRDKLDNRLQNLRWATSIENSRNYDAKSNNKIGHKHISICNRTNRYRLVIRTQKRSIIDKIFTDLDDALLNREEILSQLNNK